MKYVMFYELAEGAGPLAQQHFPEHSARLHAFHEQGSLLMAGNFTDGPVGAIGVFTSREAAEQFMDGDPFIRHGVVGASRVREWNEVLEP